MPLCASGACLTDRPRIHPACALDLASRGADVVVGVAGDVLFDSGKVDLKNSARQTLDQIASVLNTQYAGRSIRVEGYTDTDPIRKSSWKTNERLSAERAMSVEAYLVSKGIDNGRIYSAAFGPAHPRGRAYRPHASLPPRQSSPCCGEQSRIPNPRT